MRRALHSDAVAAARVLLAVPPLWRRWVLSRLIREADLAHGRVKRGFPGHRLWGDGSLMAAALRRRPSAEPSLEDAEYCRCLSMVYAAIAGRGRQPDAQETQEGNAGSVSSRARAMSSPQSRQ